MSEKKYQDSPETIKRLKQIRAAIAEVNEYGWVEFDPTIEENPREKPSRPQQANEQTQT